MIQDLSGSWCIKGTGESMTRADSSIPLMHHDPDISWITNPVRNVAVVFRLVRSVVTGVAIEDGSLFTAVFQCELLLSQH